MSDIAAPAAAAGVRRRDAVQRGMRVVKGLSPRDAALVQRMRANGILMPVRTLIAARKAKLPLPLACALLMQESGGGRNVFGHDPTIFTGAGEVTREKYLAYKAQRGRERMQGVGPCQLTWWEFQDEADRRGGCWNPEINMQVGFERLAFLTKRFGVRDGIRRYNGSGPAAERYAGEVTAKAERYRAILGIPEPAPKQRVLLPRNWWKKHVYGDTDCSRALLCALANVAKDIDRKICVTSGKRTYGEQVVLYNNYLRFGHPQAARPGTSSHEGGRAADCQANGPATHIGDFPRAREAMRRHGLCLPVQGEPWHVERGNTWRG